MALMTPEEKAKRKQERQAEEERAAEKYPGAFYYPARSLQLILKDGDPSGVTIRAKNLKEFRPDRACGEWVTAYIPLQDIAQVAQLARAIISRLNGMVEDANEDIKSIPLLAKLDKPK